MLKRIPVSDVTVGMYVQSIDGPWLEQPFWRSRFLITRVEQLAKLRSSKVSSVVINLDRSLGAAKPCTRFRTRKAIDPHSAQRRAQDLIVAKAVAADARRFMKNVFDRVRTGKKIDLAELDAVIASITHALVRNRSMLLGIMRLKTSDTYTYFHSVAVGTLMINFARELGLAEDQVRLMGLGGLFHDLGKIEISKAILNKPGRLTPGEFDEMRQHPVLGHDLLMAEDVPPLARDVCLHHHERIDGGGYPQGLVGGEISLAARMGAICDVYDALTSNRPYKRASSPVAAIAAMYSWEGHFDPKLMFTFMKSIAVFPIGMLVRLRSGHLAVVRDNGRRASRARLTVFYDISTRRLVSPRELILSVTNVSELIVEAADPSAFGLDDWTDLRGQLLSGIDPTLRRKGMGAN
jgi:putative nucleotidyltransferase with HDIG domain